MFDKIDVRILQALIQDGRASFKDVAEFASLSSPSAAERMRRLHERGVIRAYTVELDAQDCFIARLVARSIEHVDEIVDRIAEKVQTHTSIVKSQTIVRRAPPVNASREQRAPRTRWR